MASMESASGDEMEMKGRSRSNMLTCGVCMERYRSPKLLPCFHTFCQRCVEKVAGTKPSFPCPTCRTVIVMPPGGAAQLQANFYLEMDLASQGPQTECELCNKGKQAQYKCVQCQQEYCTPCRETHNAIQSCTSHTVLPLTEDSTDKEPTRDEKRCPKHKNQPLLLFCCQCEVNICVQCKLTSHDGHDTEDVVDTGERARDQLSKELQSLAQKEKVLEAAMAKTQDFQEDVKEEKEAAEKKIRDRTKEMENMVNQAEKEALESVCTIAETIINELKKQSIPVGERHAAVVAKRQHISQIIDRGDDGEAVAMLTQMKAEAEQAQSSKTREDVTVERGTVSHQFKSRAVKYTDVLAFIGMAREGPVLEMKALSLDAEILQESVKRRPRSDISLFTNRRQKIPREGKPSFVEIVYSKNPKSTLSSMCLSSDDTVWLSFNPGESVVVMALFDDDGQCLETRYENLPTSPNIITCNGDVTVSLADGKWIRPGGEVGKINPPCTNAVPSKSLTSYVCYSGKVYPFNTTTLPPEFDDTTEPWSVSSTGSTFDVSETGKFCAVNVGSSIRVFDKLDSSDDLRRYSTYKLPEGQSANDVCFCNIKGKEMLLVAISSRNSVHIVDHRDGCFYVGTIESDQCRLKTPCRLTTNHKGCVWVGCNGGKVVIFDV